MCLCLVLGEVACTLPCALSCRKDCVLWLNEGSLTPYGYVTVVCRVCPRSHVEFQLHEPPELPFWFTPAQFAGHLVISKDYSHIVKFEMELPTTKTLNIGVCV